ncbi:MAG: hypothetical protein QXX95_00510 [Nitrososphaerales archaeon]
MSQLESFTLLGLFFIILGIALILMPFLMKIINLQNLEKIPSFIIYIYKSNGFYFVTSPILIALSLLFLLLALLRG